MEALLNTTEIERYPAYKDSGIDWLGEVPEHWEVLKAKYLWKEKINLSESGEETLLSVSQYLGVNNRENDSRSESLIGYKKVNENDLVINIMLAWLGGLGLSPFNGVVSPAYAVYELLFEADPKFLHYLYRTNTYLDEFARRSRGVVPSRWRMYTDDFGQVLTLLPPLPEQTAIANFLDRKTAQIENAIRIKERQIELLKERRQILIHKAVTQGLNPDVPMKDSGVDGGNRSWIGEIPAHWEVVRLKYVSTVQSGVTLGKTYKGDNIPSYPYLRVANVQLGYFKLDDIAEISLPESIAAKYFVQNGDLLVTEGGDLDKLGRGTVWKGEIDNCLHQNHIFAIRVNHSVISSEYASLILESDYGRKYFTTTANKTTNLASTNSTKLGNIPLIVPPMHEQEEILEFVNNGLGKIDTTISLKEKEIEKLKEYKATLINSAVTGKIKVN